MSEIKQKGIKNMTKQEQCDKLLSKFDLLLSWMFSPENISMKMSDGVIEYTIKNTLNGEAIIRPRAVIKHGTPACINVFGRFTNGADYFKHANPNTGKYNFFGLDKAGIDFYMKEVINKISPFNDEELNK